MGVQIQGDTGNVIATKGTYSGNVTIGGTLTYEDVTNIDSVGLITARTGIEIGARPGVAASISVDGNMIVSGISTFGGDVQVPDKIIHSGDTNTAIRFPAADVVTVETGGSERFRVLASGGITVKNGDDQFSTTFEGGSSGSRNIVSVKAGNTTSGHNSGFRVTHSDGNTVLSANVNHNDDNANIMNEHQGGALIFHTNESGSVTEKLRIASDGKTTIKAASNAASRLLFENTGSVRTNYIGLFDDDDRIVIAADDADQGTGSSIHFKVDGTEKMIVSSDQIDINDRLDVIHNGSTNYIAQFENTNTTTPYGTFCNSPSGAAAGYPILSVNQTGASPATKFRVDSGSGRIYINTDTLFDNEYQASLYITSTGGIVFRPDGTSTRKPLSFQNNSGTEVGSISNSTGSTSFNTSSDYRLKENEVTIPDAISKVKQLKPYTFNFKADSNTTIDGFFAHEAQEVVPYAVTGEKDAEKMQSMDYGKLTPLLTAALQEAISEIETLKTEVAALKSQLNN